MSTIEANITIKVGDDSDVRDLIDLIQKAISDINGQNTDINVIEVDNPTSYSPLALKKMRERWQ